MSRTLRSCSSLAFRSQRSALSAASAPRVITHQPSRLTARPFTISRNVREAAGSTPLRASSSDTAKVSSQMRRFWKTVSLHSEDSHFEVKLDNRSLRTPEGTLLKVPKENRLLATLIVHEWNEQSRVIKSHALPMTSLAARSIDGFGDIDTRTKSIEEFLKYAETDTVCFHESDPKALVRLQGEHWDPLLDWVKERFGTRPNVAFDTLVIEQPAELISALRDHLVSLSPLRLSALEKCLHLTKSLYLSLALLEGHLSVEDAMHAAWVEQKSQIETWGEVEDSHDVGWAELGRELGAVRVAASSSV
ncbi:unnamed protein product [Sympodiomycopsis kandeliae]